MPVFPAVCSLRGAVAVWDRRIYDVGKAQTALAALIIHHRASSGQPLSSLNFSDFPRFNVSWENGEERRKMTLTRFNAAIFY